MIWSVTISGNPGDASANASKRSIIRGGRAVSLKSRRARLFEARAAEAIAIAKLRNPDGAAAVRAMTELAVRVDAYWPRQRHLDGCESLPLGDVDAPVKACLDVLESAGIIDDDVRVVELSASKRLDREFPRLTITVMAVDTARVAR